jgi:riboflavin kinase/FMN adenylyltransferase
MTFEPYPQAYFSHNDRFPRLMNLRDKFLTLKTLNVDYLLVLPFNDALAKLSAEDFIREIVVDRLKTAVVIVGDDFRFGAKRSGDFELLQSLAKQYGYDALEMPTLVFANERISSSRLRMALSDGDLTLAENLLGQPYSLSGQVVKGDQRGREFGFPTANVYVGQKKLSLSGIFIVNVDGLAEKTLRGVASVGYRPMYPTERDVLEVHLLDFDKNVYKKHCTVTFLKFLRDEVNFASEAELIVQIENDVLAARHYFTEYKSG